ncbi:MAG: primosomal protein N' family DNA-binding protein, partial [Nostoc sp.]
VNRWVEVLVDCPGSTGLSTYRLPAQLEIKPGDILTVPFKAQQVGGVAIRLLSQLPADLQLQKIWDVKDVIQRDFFPDSYWTLMERVSQYYYTQLIQVIRMALPPGLLGRSQRRIRLTILGAAVSTNTNPNAWLDTALMRAIHQPYSHLIKFYLLNSIENNYFIKTLALFSFQCSVGKVNDLNANKILQLLQQQSNGDHSFRFLQRQLQGRKPQVDELLRRSLVESYLKPPRLTKPKFEKAVTLVGSTIERDLNTRQREILEVLRRRGGELWLNEFLQICKTTTPTLKGLEEKGYIVIEEREVLRTEQGPQLVGDGAKSLTAAQASALETIQRLDGFAKVLLHGVTGSGKTEVYLQAIAPLLNQGKSALVLV